MTNILVSVGRLSLVRVTFDSKAKSICSLGKSARNESIHRLLRGLYLSVLKCIGMTIRGAVSFITRLRSSSSMVGWPPARASKISVFSKNSNWLFDRALPTSPKWPIFLPSSLSRYMAFWSGSWYRWFSASIASIASNRIPNSVRSRPFWAISRALIIVGAPGIRCALQWKESVIIP